MNKDVILFNKDEQIEKLSHEITMVVIVKKFNKSFDAGMIAPNKEVSYLIDSYLQHKKWAINDILRNYEVEYE